VTASPLPGPSGNVEFFVWFRRDAPPAVPERIRAVVAAGPSGTVASGAASPPPAASAPSEEEPA
jgi:23S rRNA (cytidine1920-2'-O)/16S rRNA (cytidine1409-2'-O)-methyltransferase